MKVADVQTGPLTGYRLWRVMTYQPLDGPPTVRLCTAGRHGLPPVWPPREPITAACSDFHSTHAAPSFGHECGVWAVTSREDAEKRVSDFLNTSNFDGALGYAVGEVALWGRVVKHEQGLRAQYAYPIRLSVTTRRLRSALVLADVYGVPVEWQRRRRVRPKPEAEPKPRGESRATLRSLNAGLDAIQAELGGLADRVAGRVVDRLSGTDLRERYDREQAVKRARAKDELVRLSSVALDGLTVDEALVGLAVASASGNEAWPGLHEIAAVLLERRGVEGPYTYEWGEGGPLVRRGFIAARNTLVHVLDAAVQDGLAETGRPQSHYHRHRRWYLTTAGITRTCGLLERLPLLTVTRRFYGGGTWKEVAIDVLGHMWDQQPRDPDKEPFRHEVEAAQAAWLEERLAARRRGERAHAAWLLERRSLPRASHQLRYGDEEILVALRCMCQRSRGPVAFAAVMHELAPGRPLAGERSAVSYRLGKLAAAGDVQRIQTGSALRWGLETR